MATLKLTTSLGTQYTDVGFHRTDAYGAKLLAGSGSLAGTAARFSVGETTNDIRTLGFLGREQLALARPRVPHRLGAHRPEQRVRRELHARAVSVGERVVGARATRSSSRRSPLLSSLRLRAAMGSAGQNPGYLAAEQYYLPVTAIVQGQDVPAFTVGGAGNSTLKPEKSTEREMGFDLGVCSATGSAWSTRTTTSSRATSW